MKEYVFILILLSWTLESYNITFFIPFNFVVNKLSWVRDHVCIGEDFLYAGLFFKSEPLFEVNPLSDEGPDLVVNFLLRLVQELIFDFKKNLVTILQSIIKIAVGWDSFGLLFLDFFVSLLVFHRLFDWAEESFTVSVIFLYFIDEWFLWIVSGICGRWE